MSKIRLQNKPYVVMTKDGDYFFTNKKKARAFAIARHGFFDFVAKKQPKGGDAQTRPLCY